LAVTSSRKPRATGPILTELELELEATADDRSGPDAPIVSRQGPASFLKPDWIAVDTSVVAVAHDGEWIYPTGAVAHAA